ncbi:MAG: AraC family ligand binding domain-containing protein, partial [Bacillota bacterium]|nr:AraC family ligand binding domain-containing protein [Bacillota bacterium]
METARKHIAEKVIKTNIGPICFNIFLDTSLAGSNTEQHNERHQHATYELQIIEEGTGAILMDETEHPISGNRFFLIKSGIYH